MNQNPKSFQQLSSLLSQLESLNHQLDTLLKQYGYLENGLITLLSLTDSESLFYRQTAYMNLWKGSLILQHLRLQISLLELKIGRSRYGQFHTNQKDWENGYPSQMGKDLLTEENTNCPLENSTGQLELFPGMDW